jgi:hypothetical protein
MQLFIVFHKYIFDECYSSIPQDILDKYFTFIAVNKTITKYYTPNKYKVINEWELPIYDNSFQERGYNENSAIYHVFINNLHKTNEYVGFFQYDMIFENSFVNQLINIVNDNLSKKTCFCIMPRDYKFCTYVTWQEPKTADFIINDYESFYKQKFNKIKEGPLLNSFIISSENYNNIMQWVTQLYNKLYPWCIQEPNWTYKGHIGNIYERIMAYAISQFSDKIELLKITHNNGLKSNCY